MEAQEDVKNEENRRCEDWLVDGTDVGNDAPWSENSNGAIGELGNDATEDIGESFSS